MNDALKRDLVYGLICGLITYITTSAISLIYTLTGLAWIVIMEIICCSQLVFFIVNKRYKMRHALIRCLITTLAVLIFTVVMSPLYRIAELRIVPDITVMQANVGGMLTLFSFMLCFITAVITLLTLFIFHLTSKHARERNEEIKH